MPGIAIRGTGCPHNMEASRSPTVHRKSYVPRESAGVASKALGVHGRGRTSIRHHKSTGWMERLPDLTKVSFWQIAVRSYRMLTAVWMHLDQAQRQRAMPRVASLVRPGGVQIMSLRYGPVPRGRRMFTVSVEETIQLAGAQGLQPILKFESADAVLRRPGVSWARLAFRKQPDR